MDERLPLAQQAGDSGEEVPEALRVKLDIFEGPLDLLLHLIKKEEIDIYDIPIARITERYLEYLEMMKDLNINVAGEWLVMASTLILIKSRMLLPPDPQAAEVPPQEDPRMPLVQQLLEHQKFKQAAQMLYERETVELSSWTNPKTEFQEEEAELVSATVFDLVQAFHAIVERFRDRIVMEMRHDEVTVDQKLAELRAMLALQPAILFSALVERGISKLHLIVTFLALLEMARLGEIRVFQEQIHTDIRIVKV
ncbi:MAG: segregation/condensation protein A [Acidobacteria bacterium]|nr:segregation/condensation protein A [Acidobacteriota bacterium]